MGKYDGLKSRLPKLQEEPSAYRVEVDKLKEEIKRNDTSLLLVKYVRARAEVDAIELQLKEARKILMALTESITERYEDTGVTSMQLASGAMIRVQVEPYAQVKDKEALLHWVRETGLENLLTLPWQTLNSMTKERLLSGEGEPPGVEAYMIDKLVLVKG